MQASEQSRTPAQEQPAEEESKSQQMSYAERMATMAQPNVDTRVKTEDVTATSGKTFRDFGLSEEV